MEPKKTTKADLENKLGIFKMLGLVISLSLILYAFNAGGPVSPVTAFESSAPVNIVEEVIPPTTSDDPKTQVLPPPPRIIDVFTEVDDRNEIDEIFEFQISDPGKILIINELPKIKKEVVPEDTIFYVVESMPVFPGGEKALLQWIGRSIKYPEEASVNGDQGIVYVQFVVDKDGRVTNARVPRKLSKALDEEALRVISNMPRWQPGKQRGVPVRVSYTVPIHFELE